MSVMYEDWTATQVQTYLNPDPRLNYLRFGAVYLREQPVNFLECLLRLCSD